MPLKSVYPAFFLTTLLIASGCVKSPTSPASNWAEVTAHAAFSGRYGLSGTVFNNSMWVVGGAAGNSNGSVTYYYSDVWTSSNGSSWTEKTANAPFGGRYGSQLLSFNGKLWLIAGNKNGTLVNDVWSSSDGVTWTQVLAQAAPSATQFSSREDFGAVVYNNAMWVIGGYGTGPISKNDVWSSADGITWTQVLANGPSSAGQFAPRWGLSAVVYNNAMWVLSGAHSTVPNVIDTAYGDAWSSTTGGSWTQAANLNPYNLSYYHQVVANNNLMWLTAGFLWNNWGPESTVWTSGNGANWSNVPSAFPPRFYHLSLAFNNQVWVIAGCNNSCNSTSNCSVTYLNDVWRTQ